VSARAPARPPGPEGPEGGRTAESIGLRAGIVEQLADGLAASVLAAIPASLSSGAFSVEDVSRRSAICCVLAFGL